jgi:hypothetical protein
MLPALCDLFPVSPGDRNRAARPHAGQAHGGTAHRDAPRRYPSVGALLIRNLFRTVDSLPAFYVVGLICCFVSANRVRIGDMAAGTLLVVEDGGAAKSLERVSAFAGHSRLSLDGWNSSISCSSAGIRSNHPIAVRSPRACSSAWSRPAPAANALRRRSTGRRRASQPLEPAVAPRRSGESLGPWPIAKAHANGSLRAPQPGASLHNTYLRCAIATARRSGGARCGRILQRTRARSRDRTPTRTAQPHDRGSRDTLCADARADQPQAAARARGPRQTCCATSARRDARAAHAIFAIAVLMVVSASPAGGSSRPIRS